MTQVEARKITRPESPGLIKFRGYLQTLGEDPKLPPTSVMMQETELGREQILHYIKHLRGRKELALSNPAEKSRRLSDAQTAFSGGPYLKIVPYGKLRMSPRETRLAMIIDGVIDPDNTSYQGKNLASLFARARNNGLVDRFTPEEGTHVDGTTIGPSDNEIRERDYLWLNASDVLQDALYRPQDRLQWFDLLTHLNREKYFLGEEGSVGVISTRVTNMDWRMFNEFRGLVLNWGGDLNQMYTEELTKLGSIFGNSLNSIPLSVAERMVLCAFYTAKVQQSQGRPEKMVFLQSTGCLPGRLFGHFKTILGKVQNGK
ncbi:MAG: hypothetical protein Q7R49_03055 [Candidatus Daviesbacteria bacterium]|nr:hypothetical protein [Candidatus Daviesbacteria bacterium]